MLNRWYLTLLRLSKMYSHLDPTCWPDSSSQFPSHLAGMFKTRKKFGSKLGWLSGRFQDICFSYTPEKRYWFDFDTSCGSKGLVANMLSAATLLLAQKWNSQQLPSVAERLIKVRHMSLLNKTLCS